MQKFLRTLMLVALMAVPFASSAQEATANRTYLVEDFTVAPTTWSGSTNAYSAGDLVSGDPAWTWTEYSLNGCAAGHYYVNLYNQNRYYWLATPVVDLTESGEAKLEFDMALTKFSGTASPDSCDPGKKVMLLYSVNGGGWQILAQWVKNPEEGDSAMSSITNTYRHYSYTLGEEFLGKRVHFAFYCENTDNRRLSVNLHLDNVSVTGKVTCLTADAGSLHATTIGTNAITVAWTDHRNPAPQSYLVRILNTANEVVNTMNVPFTGDRDNLAATFTGLTPATIYNFDVRTYNDATTFSKDTLPLRNVMTHYQSFVEELPYFNNFEANDATAGWNFVNNNGERNCGWFVGAITDSAKNGQYTLGEVLDSAILGDTVWKAGTTEHTAANIDSALTVWTPTVYDTLWAYDYTTNHVLWVSEDNGAHNTYTHYGSSYSAGNTRTYAWFPITLEAGDYDLNFDWRANGESNCDFAKVYLVPESTVLDSTTAPASDWIAISGTYAIQGQTSWKHTTNTFTLAEAGCYKLAFYWQHDYSADYAPAAAIDNVKLSQVICYAPQDIAVVSDLIDAHHIGLTWVDTISNGTSFRITAIGGGDTLVENVTGVEMPYLFGNNCEGGKQLKRETSYLFTLVTVCGEDNESNPSTAYVIGTTTPSCYAAQELAIDSVSRNMVRVAWVDTINGEGTHYLVKILQAGETVDSVVVTGMNATITGLSDLTDYTAEVYTQCVEDTIKSTINFTTPAVNGEPCGEFIFADGTATNSYVPVYGKWADAYLKAHFVYPASMLTDIPVGTAISEIKFYLTSPAAAAWTGTFAVYLDEVDYTSISSYANVNSMQKVYDGQLDATTTTMTVTFTEPYVYNGGNLLMAVEQYVKGNYKSCTFKGVTAAGSCVQNYNSSSLASVTAVQQNFLPKFSYELACPSTDMTVQVSDRTNSGATFTWNNPLASIEENADHFVVTVDTLGGENVFTQQVEGDALTYSTTALVPSAKYNVTVEAFYADGYSIKCPAVTFETFGPCNAPVNFTAVAGRTTIDLTWEQEVSNVDTYDLWVDTMDISEDSLSHITNFTVVNGNEGYSIVNLDRETTYYLYFRANCGNGSTSMWRDAVATTKGLVDCSVEGTLVTVGDGTSTDYAPICGYYGYERNAMLYTPADGLVSGLISSLAWNFSQAATVPAKIYMKNTSATELPATSSFIWNNEIADATLVYDGSAALSTGWKEILLDTPFEYTGGNLIVYVASNKTGSGGATAKAYYTQSGSNNHIVVKKDGSIDDNATFYSISSYQATLDNKRSNIKFGFCGAGSACASAEVTVSDVTYNGANLSWERPDCKVLGYTLVYADSAITNFEGVNGINLDANVNNYAFTTLDENKTYYVYLRTRCAEAAPDSISGWAEATFSTPLYCLTPTDLTVERTAKNAALVSWKPATEEKNFTLICDTMLLSADSLSRYAGSPVAAIADSSYQLNGLEYDQTYYVWVKNVCDLSGQNAYSTFLGPISFHTGKQMTDVKNLTADVYRNTITATWEADSNNFGNDTAWRVAIAKKGYDVPATAWQHVTVPTYQFTGLEFDTVYTVYVAAYDNGVTSDTAQVDATTGIAMPMVINLTAEVYRNTITATWESDSLHNAIDTAWNVAIALKDSVPTTWQHVNVRTAVFDNLEYDSTYTVHVVALYGDMHSDDTARVDATCGMKMPMVRNFTAQPMSYNYAQLNWERGVNAIENEWLIAVKATSDNSTFVYNSINHMDTMLFNLETSTQYSVRIIAVNGNDSSETAEFTFTTTGLPSDCTQLGTGTASANLLYTSYGNTYSQHIYTAEELNAMGYTAGTITGVSFDYSGTSSSYSKTQSVYIGTTSLDVFNGSTAADFETGLTLVYGPTLNSYQSGWRSYEFTTPFVWDGTSNIVVAMLSNSNASSANGWSTRGTFQGTGNYRTIYRYRDNTEIDINNLASVSYGSRTNTRPNIQFCFESDYLLQHLVVENITDSTAEASWMPAGHETTWEYVNAEGEMTDAELEAATKTVTHELGAAITGLTVATDYTFYVRAVDTVDIDTIAMVLDSVRTWTDTTYSRENPLTPVITPRSENVMKVKIDTVLATATTAGAFILPTDSVFKAEPATELDSTLTTWKVAKVHHDTVFNQAQYSAWSKAAYSTPFGCITPDVVTYEHDSLTATSVRLIATAAEAVNGMVFRYAVEGSEEYSEPVAGVLDTFYIGPYVVNYIYDTIDTLWVGYDCQTYEDIVSDTVTGGCYYDYDLYEDVPVDTLPMEFVLSDLPVDSVMNIDTIPYYYADITGLTPKTVYQYQAQVTCGAEIGNSRWVNGEMFTTECAGMVELPYSENFGDASLTRTCWSMTRNDTSEAIAAFYSSNAGLAIAYNSDTVSVDRYVVSPEFAATDSLLWNFQARAYGYGYDSLVYGYSTTDNALESFVWMEDTIANGTSVITKTVNLPAATKYVAYHVFGSKPYGNAKVANITIREMNHYNVVAYNDNTDKGAVVMTINNDTVEAADVYNEDLYENSEWRLTAVPNHGNHFVNWTRVANGNNNIPAGTTSSISGVNKDTLVIAHFDANKNKVHVEANTVALGTATIVTSKPDSILHDSTNVHGTSFTLKAVDTVTTDRFHFAGWYKSKTNVTPANLISTENPYTFVLDAETNNATQNFYACFTIDSVNMNVAFNEEMGTVKFHRGTTTINLHNGDNMVPFDTVNRWSFTATANYGYEFYGWKDANSAALTDSVAFDTIPGVNMSFAVNFNRLPYYVQVASNDETVGTATVNRDEGLYGDTIVFTATPVAGSHYHFQNWDNGSTNNPDSVILTEDMMRIAFFHIDTLPVNVIAREDMGTVAINGADTNLMWFNYGTTGVEVEAIPNTGVAFVNWTVGNETVTGNPLTLDTITDTVNVTANFDSITYNVAVNFNTAEGVVFDTLDTPVANESTIAKRYGDEIVLVAQAVSGFRFTNWTDAEGVNYYSDTLTYTVNENEEQSVTAQFVEAGKVNITLSTDTIAGTVVGAGTYNNVMTNTVDGLGRFDSVSTFTMTATANEHYHFINWTSADTVYSTEATVELDSLYKFGVEALYFTANFELDTHVVKAVAMNNMGTFTYDGVAADSVYANYGAVVAVKAIANLNHHFVAWNNGSLDTTINVTVTGDMLTDTAIFARDTFYVMPAVNNELFGSVAMTGAYRVDDTAAWYNYGDSAYMTATANTGFHLVNWNNDNNYTNLVYKFQVLGNGTHTAVFDTNVYNVTLVAENGAIEGPATAKHFVPTQYVAVPAYGYHFASWTNVTSDNDTAILNAVSDTTITANFAKNSYVVAGVANNELFGTVAGTDTVLYKDTVTLIATPAVGYHVANWSNGMTGDTIEIVADSNINVIANFDTNVYNVTINVNDNAMGTVLGDATMKHFESKEYVAVANYGYHFAGWDVDSNATDTLTVAAISDTIINATFAKNEYAAAVNVNDTVMGIALVSNEHPLYLDTVTYQANANAHYRFIGWMNEAGDTVSTLNTFKVVVANDTALTATFEAIMDSVHILVNNATMGSVNPAGDTVVMEGTILTITATANEGYNFVNWSNGDTTETINVVVMSDTTLTANFVAIPTYTVTVTVNDSTMGHVEGVPTEAVLAGTELTLVAVAEEGYHFVAWSTGATTDTLNLTVNEDVTLTATFAQTVILPDSVTFTFMVNNETMGTVTPNGTVTYAVGTQVTATATAAEGYTFVNWSVIVDGGTATFNEASSYTATVLQEMVGHTYTIVANFAEATQTITVTVTVNDTNMGTVSGAGVYHVGETVTLEAVAKEGYRFVRWSDGNTNALRTFTATEDVTLEAIFERGTGIEDVETVDFTVYSVNNTIVVKGVENMNVYVFDVNGRTIEHMAKATETVEFTVNTTGVYLVKVGNAPAKRVVVVR